MSTLEFLEESFTALLNASPEVAAELGIDRIGQHPIAQNTFADASPEGQAARAQLMARTLQSLRALPPAPPASADTLNRELYEFFLRWCDFGRLPGTESHDYLLCDSPAEHIGGVQAELITLLAQWQPLATAEHLQDYLHRLGGVGRQIDRLIASLSARVAAGNVMPHCIVTRVLAELATFLACSPRENPLALRIVATGKETQIHLAIKLIADGVYPAFRRLSAYLGAYPLEPRIGLCRLSRGKGYYRYLLKAHTTTDLTPREVHELGAAEAARLQAELNGKLRALGYPGREFAERLQAFESDERVRVSGEAMASMQAQIDAILQRSREQLLPLFHRQPHAEVIAQSIPKLQEPNLHSTYIPPARDGSRPGVFRFNTAQLAAGTQPDLYTVVYHETIPGHHVQLTIAQELGSELPAFRRAAVHSAYIEGWAKYAELLPWIEGVNRDPYWDVARTWRELVSTVNLTLDTGIHSFGWSREDAVEHFQKGTGCGREVAEFLVDRAIARPAQLCAYKIGMMRLLGARRRMEQALGSRFDVRAFHDAVLGHGSVPLAVLDRLVDAAIERGGTR